MSIKRQTSPQPHPLRALGNVMWIIDRYLLRQFLQTFVICYCSLTGLYVIFDLFTNLEEFLRCAEKAGSLLGLMGSYYSYRAILFFDRASGLLALVAAMFTVTWIQRHNEMTALMAAGISRLRVVVPVIGAAIVITLLATANRELVIPQLREELSRKTTDLMGDRGQEMEPCYDNQTDILLRGKFTYADEQRIESPDFLLPPGLGQNGNQIVAKDAFCTPANEDHPAGYLLKGVTLPADLHLQRSLPAEGDPVVITPGDAPGWLKPDECFVTSDVSFEQLTGGQSWRMYASTFQLVRGLHNRSLDFGADVRVVIHSRIVQPFLDVTLLFLGLPLVLTRESRNVFVAIGLCMVMVSIFMLVVLGFQHLGSIYLLSPSLAAWAPLMIFVPLAVGLAEPLWESSPRRPKPQPALAS
jgi:lipopolysaccharide export system permease protein